MIERRFDTTGQTSESDETVEGLALAGASAIQHLISDRDAFRNLTAEQRQELTGLRARNEDLHRRLLAVRQSYLTWATEILSQFERFDGALREAVGDNRDTSSSSTDATLIDLAQRLSPMNRPSRLEDTGKSS